MLYCKDYGEWCEKLQKECVVVIFGKGCVGCPDAIEVKTGKGVKK